MVNDATDVKVRDGRGTHGQTNPPVDSPPLPGDPTAHLVAVTSCILQTVNPEAAVKIAVAQLEHARDVAARTATAFDQILNAVRSAGPPGGA